MIARDYIRRFRKAAHAELHYYAEQSTLTDAIRVAALSRRDDEKRHSHQQRIPGRVLASAEASLQENSLHLSRTASFSQLHEKVEAFAGSIKGIGPLAVYDIAHRIGAFLRLEPELVYLHAGTRDGARVLGIRGKVVERSELPAGFGLLSAAEIEDCLCIYKDELDAPRQAARSCVAPRSCGSGRPRNTCH